MRRSALRSGISRTETVISCVVLLLIAGIGVAVYVKGQIYDPGLFRLDQHALSKSQPARVPADRLNYHEDEKSVKSLETIAKASATAGLLDALNPKGWKTMGNVEQFTAGSLYEKIDGRAEQYLDYKFVRLTCTTLVNEQDSSQFIDVYVFDMGLPVQAFGVFSVERTEGLPAFALGREGYRVEASYFFWKGRYYVQVLPSVKGKVLAQVSLDVAKALEKRLADDGEPIWGLTALPEQDRIPGTVQYFVVDAMSLDFMKDTYIALYRKGGAKVMAFLSRKPSPDAAAKTLASYESYLKNFGKVMGKRETDNHTLITGNMGGAFDVVFRKGRLIGGVSMVNDQSIAEKAAADLLTALHDKD